ncbi:MAG: hypothetical protein V3T65_02280, partial [Acidobacteriota bacterium]
ALGASYRKGIVYHGPARMFKQSAAARAFLSAPLPSIRLPAGDFPAPMLGLIPSNSVIHEGNDIP